MAAVHTFHVKVRHVNVPVGASLNPVLKEWNQRADTWQVGFGAADTPTDDTDDRPASVHSLYNGPTGIALQKTTILAYDNSDHEDRKVGTVPGKRPFRRP